ncbi:hypothetical protein PsorP6_004339 [Peronosclerospora sorghi]|uniref:Uncharacterized protein n=1 Tax=Peronosclerospora sorghi TaxID=230839 RepID=A0ACC0VSH5_9STRA|nr:hypothetical protein PsorP6_004339 [Peronosclerospora sorghi]
MYTVNELLPRELLFTTGFAQRPDVSSEVEDDLLKCTTNGAAVAPVYKQLFAIEDPTAAFVWLSFSNLPFLCFQLQARRIARVFSGSVSLPSKRMYEDFYAYLRDLNEGVRKLRQLGVRQKDYFIELAAFSKTEVGEEIHEMYEYARFLRQNFPYSNRTAEFFKDPATGKWKRCIKSRNASTEIVKEFSG